MFDIGFSELLVIGVVALIVVGPERLPKVARTMGHLFGRVQRYAAEVKADINRELKLEELRKIEADLREKAQSAEHVILEEARSTESGIKAAAEQVADPFHGLVPPASGAPDAGVAAPAGEPSPQLELGLETAPKPAEKEKSA